MIGFKDVKGYGFGLYPFPNFMQPFFERFDPKSIAIKWYLLQENKEIFYLCEHTYEIFRPQISIFHPVIAHL